MAAFTTKAQRPYAVHHGLILSGACEWSQSVIVMAVSKWRSALG